MRKVSFTMIGKKPMLFNRLVVEAITNKNKPRDGGSGNSPSEWKDKIWCEGKRLFQPDFCVLSALTQAGKFVKQGRGSISKTISSAIEVMDPKIYILNRELPDTIDNLDNDIMSHDSSHPVYIDVRAVTNPMTKGKNIRYRLALSPGWEARVNLEWNEKLLSKDQIVNLIDAFGSLVGLSDGRTIGCGRFDVKDVVFTS